VPDGLNLGVVLTSNRYEGPLGFINRITCMAGQKVCGALGFLIRTPASRSRCSESISIQFVIQNDTDLMPRFVLLFAYAA
jgi:hypothetical protein